MRNKHPRWLRIVRLWVIHILRLGFVVLIGKLIWVNKDAFINPPGAADFNQLIATILSNKANLQIIAAGSFFSIIGFFYIVLKIPFANWENLKLFGFEMKKATEIQLAAKEELSYSNEIDWLRVRTLETISSDLGYEIIDPYIKEDEFDGVGAFNSILQEVVDIYKKKLDIHLDFGVLKVSGKEMERTDTNGLPNIVRKTLFCALWEVKPQSLSEEGESVVVAPVILTGKNVPEYITFLYVKDYVFDKRDEAHLQAIVNIVKTNADLALVPNVLAEGGIA